MKGTIILILGMLTACANQAPVYRLVDISCSWLEPIELSEQATSDPLTDEQIAQLFVDIQYDGYLEDVIAAVRKVEAAHMLTAMDFYRINSLNDAIAANCGYTSGP